MSELLCNKPNISDTTEYHFQPCLSSIRLMPPGAPFPYHCEKHGGLYVSDLTTYSDQIKKLYKRLTEKGL